MPTPNRGYNTPTAGTTDWHIPLNENFNLIDEDIQQALDQTGGGGGTVEGGTPMGPWGVGLIGSSNSDNPQSGLTNAINSALNNGDSILHIRGAWEMGDTLSVDSTNFAPNPILIDARGAYIEYSGNGFAFVNDCTGNISGQIQGGRFVLLGGSWQSFSNPNGFWRGIDQSFAELRPRVTNGFDGSDSAIYELVEGTQWCESNVLSGVHVGVDTGIRSISSQGTSFQDNYVHNIQFGRTKDYGFDLSGNWIDCTIDNPTVIASASGTAFLRQDGNMGGTEIISPEFESASSTPSHTFMVEVAPLAKRGPIMRGGDHGPREEELVFFDTRPYDQAQNDGNPQTGSGWTFNMDRQTQGRDLVREQYSRDGASRQIVRSGSGVFTENSAYQQTQTSGTPTEWNPW